MTEEIKTLFDAFYEDAKKAEKGNKSAGVRARRVSLELDKKLFAFRRESIKW